MKANGLNGQILRVDLSQEKLEPVQIDEQIFRHYGGGSGLGLYYLLKNMPARLDALAPEAIITFMLSPITGAPISGQSRMSINAKSPASGAIGDSQVGGFFPAQLKFAGFDGLIVSGKAAKPCYLYLHEGKAELRDARQLWGKTTLEVEQTLKTELADEKIEILQIGPAGERSVNFAAVITMANRAAGRTGMGAVMGSKNLKAIVVKGRANTIQFADSKGVATLAKWGAKNVPLNEDMLGLHEDGTAGVLSSQQAIGSLPTRNYNEGQFESFNDIGGETMTEEILKDQDTCYACAVRCKRVVEVSEGAYQANPAYGGPEYESLATFGSYCGVANLAALAYANEICNAYGMDTVSCGATIAWAMEMYEHGELSLADTGGLDLRFGNEQAMIAVLEQIADGSTTFGRLLGLGSAHAADKLGKGHDYLITVKKQEAPAHMPQAKRSLGLIYAVNPFGADHQSSEHDGSYEPDAAATTLERLSQIGLPTDRLTSKDNLNDDKIRFALETQKTYSALDSFSVCQFVYGPAWALFGPQQLVDLISTVTGWQDFSVRELQTVGERRLTLMRLFNHREGLGRQDDKLPKKFFRALKGRGPTAGVALQEADIERAKDVYYQAAGWTSEGVPTAQLLQGLELDEFTHILN